MRTLLPLLLLTACAAPAQETVIGSPPTRDPVTAVSNGPALKIDLSADPKARRKEVLAQCYLNALRLSRFQSKPIERFHVLLSARRTGSLRSAGVAPEAKARTSDYRACVLNAIQQGLFPEPGRDRWLEVYGVEVTIERQGPEQYVSTSPWRVTSGGLGRKAWTSRLRAMGPDIRACRERDAARSHGDRRVAFFLEGRISSAGDLNALRLLPTDRSHTELAACLREVFQRERFPATKHRGPRFARHILVFQ